MHRGGALKADNKGIPKTQELINDGNIPKNSENITSALQSGDDLFADIKLLKTEQYYSFTNTNTILEFVNVNLQNIEYLVLKDIKGNITIKNQNNCDIEVYNCEGYLVSQ